MAQTLATASWGKTVVGGFYGDPSATRIKALASSTNATSVKATAGMVHGIIVGNNAASARFLKFYDKASAPVVGTDTPLFTVIIPANTVSPPVPFDSSIGIPFINGIAFAITTGIADSDTNGTSLDDVHGVLVWS